MTARPRSRKAAFRALDLPRELREERGAVIGAAVTAWERARLAGLSREQWRDIVERRRREILEELRAGPVGHALRAAAAGDPSTLATIVTRGRVPPELADLVFSVIVAAPWARRRRGGQRRLTAVDEVGIGTLFVVEHRINGRRRDAVIDALAERFHVSGATVERALAASGVVTNRPFKRARGRR